MHQHDGRHSAAGFYLDYGSFEEVFIGAAANSAEMPNPGVLTQFVSKSGGSRLSVNLYDDYETTTSRARNLPGEETPRRWGATIRPDGNRLASYRNFNIAVGGPLVKRPALGDFVYVNQKNSVAAPPAGGILDGTPFDTKLFNYTGKGHLSAQTRTIGSSAICSTVPSSSRTARTAAIASAPRCTSSANSTVLQDSPSWVYKAEWNGTIGQNMFAEFRAGQFGYNFGLDSNTTDTRYETLTTNEILGGGRDWLNRRRRNQYTGAVNFFKDSFARRLA